MKTQTRTRTRSEFHVRIEGFQSLRIVEDILIPPFSDVPGRGALLLNHIICNTLDGYNDTLIIIQHRQHQDRISPIKNPYEIATDKFTKAYFISEPTCKWSSSHNKRSGEQML